MRSLSRHPNHYIKKIFSFSIGKEKYQVYQQKKEKQNLILMIWFSETLPSLSSCVDIDCSSAEYNSAKSLTNKYKLFGTKSKQTVNFPNIPKIPFPLTPSKKYIMIEKFKNRLNSLKQKLIEIKN